MNIPIKKAVILAGGKATRLYPLTKELSKPLLPVKKKPIINYLVDNFHKHGVKDIVVLVSQDFQEDFVWWKRRYYPSAGSGQAPSAGSRQGPASPAKRGERGSLGAAGQASDIKLIEEKEPLGTFGGAWYLKDWIGDSHFFFTNGDELKEIDLDKMKNFHLEMVRQAHHKTSPSATIALVKVPNPQDYGVVVCNEGLVEEFLEKPDNPPSDYINSGFYLFTPDVFKYHPGPKFCMVETDLFPQLAKEKKLAGFQFEGKWMDCGTWERYKEALESW